MANLNLIARLGFDGKAYDAGMAKAQVTAAKFGNQVKNQLAGAFAAGAIAVQIKSTIEAASRINDYAAAIGTTTDRIQELEYASKLTGGNLDEMVRVLRQLGKARRDALADPSGQEAAAFGSLGIGADQLKSASDPVALFQTVADAVKRLNVDLNSTPVLMTLLGSRAGSVITMMKTGFSDLSKEAHDLNAVLDPGMVESLDKVGDTIDKALLRLRGPFANVVLFIARAIDTVVYIAQQAYNTLEGFGARVFRVGAAIADFATRNQGSNKPGWAQVWDQAIDDIDKRGEELRNKFLDTYDPKVGARTAAGKVLGTDDLTAGMTNKDTEDAIKGAEETRKLIEQISDKSRRNRLMEMTDAERLVELEKERLELREQFSKARSGKESLEIAGKIYDVEGEIIQAKKGMNNRPGSDSLAQIGGRLGGTDYGAVQAQNIVKIEANTRQTMLSAKDVTNGMRKLTGEQG